jgi:hypothetical protein
MREDGVVTCGFTRATIPQGSALKSCPHAARSLQFAAEYRFNNTLWLHDFESVYKRMLINRYDRAFLCPVGNITSTQCL